MVGIGLLEPWPGLPRRLYEGYIKWNSFGYLGIWIHKGIKKRANWKDLVQKIKNKIQSLGAIWLNRTGKLTLINVVLPTFPIFTSSISLGQNSIIQDIGKELRCFFWKGGKHNNSKKLHLINWDTVCRQNDSGGEGVKELAAMNLALGAKNIWQMIAEKNPGGRMH